ncbi:MAG: hypothetical protein QM605_08630, partial [Sphingobium sp.]
MKVPKSEPKAKKGGCTMANRGIYVRGFSNFARGALLASGACFAGIVPAMAQDETEESRESGESSAQGGGEIVVTALKRGTRLQDTPLAISAVTGDTLARAGKTSFTELTT